MSEFEKIFIPVGDAEGQPLEGGINIRSVDSWKINEYGGLEVEVVQGDQTTTYIIPDMHRDRALVLLRMHTA